MSTLQNQITQSLDGLSDDSLRFNIGNHCWRLLGRTEAREAKAAFRYS